MNTTNALELLGVHKRFGRNEALKGVDLNVRAGEVHGLLGKNGAGKSTLINVIGGVLVPDQGSVWVGGSQVELGSPKAARDQGVAVVHQDLSLVPLMTIAENIQLGRWSRRNGLLDSRAMNALAKQALERVELGRNPQTRVAELGMAERQLVEIAKALIGNIRVLLLDEPTSSLSDREAERLFGVVRELRNDGVAVIYVSHRLSEVLALTDRISILRDGQIESPIASKDATERQLAKLMVGHTEQIEISHNRASLDDRAVVLSVQGLCVGPRLKEVSFEAHKGELIAVFGLMGAGRTRLARALFGLEEWTGGKAELNGMAYRPTSSRSAIKRGVGLVGDDRSAGLVPRMSVAENIVLGGLAAFKKRGQWDRHAAREVASDLVLRLGIKTESVDVPVNSLSGGNQQKILLARWLCTGARLLILDDPARGVDVGAKEEIFAELKLLVDSGATILYFTSDAAEARRLGDRILVMAGGRMIAELDPTSGEDSIVAAAGGLRV